MMNNSRKMMNQRKHLSENRKKKKSTDGWSWFERVKIPAGDETKPIAQFNNSVDFSAVTPDGGNIVTGGMSVGEALDALNEEDDEDIKSILAIYLQDTLVEYLNLSKDIKDLESRFYSLTRSNHKPEAWLLPTIREKKEKRDKLIKDIYNELPDGVTIDDLLCELQKMWSVGKKRTLTDKELNRIQNQPDRGKIKPNVGQLFRFYSFIPTKYRVKKVDNNLVYYCVDGRSDEKIISLDDFNKYKETGTIWYI